LNPDKIRKYKNAISWRANPNVQEMQKLYERVKDCKANNEIDGSHFYSFIERVGKTFAGNVDNKDAFRGLCETDAKKLFSADFATRVPQRPEIQDILQRMQELATPCRMAYLSSTITSRFLNDLAMMDFVYENVTRNLEEANAILLARTAYVLQSALKPGDADFILEKAGIRYRHIMIDEFQDTSTLQWEVFCQLINEMLASGGTTLIVGDVKQSIYRWRNGDYRIMQGMHTTHSLTKNFRSQARVVEFNHNLFEHLCRDGGYAHQFADIYRETKTDERGNPLPFDLADYCNKADKDAGYVQVKTYWYKSRATEEELKRSVAKERIMNDVFADIGELLDRGAAMGDILILVRTNKQAKDLISHYANSALPARGIRLCSNDSFLLESSRSVQVVVNALKYIASGEAMADMYLKMCGIPVESLGKSLMRLPLNELVEKVMKMTLFDGDGKLRFDDKPFLNSFIDEVGNYVNSYGSNINDFLVYWDDKLHGKAIPASGNEGVRIMTIHSAKGLESKYVFIPFCDWELVKDNDVIWHNAVCKPDADKDVEMLKLIPTATGKYMTETDYKDAYEAEHEAQKVDNLNLLYVALTRAADQLYVYADVALPSESKPKKDEQKDNEPKTVGALIRDFVGDDFYCVGSKDIIADKKPVDDTPFEHHFNDEEVVGYSFCSNEDAIRFRQSQESMSYIQRGAEDADKISLRINAGNLRHDIFAHINTMADTDRVIHDFYTKGIIETQAEAEAIAEEMARAWRNPQMADWFGGGWRVLREVSVLRPKDEYDADVAAWRNMPAEQRGPMPKRELRPDRVMVCDDEA
ncbi:MAG: UvrD-helicase domain-containing protein, partial [Bacteroidaceae bacterium]|nr:UvrD-helicase domain-containing protein [Bacteroidaceae bacterium]